MDKLGGGHSCIGMLLLPRVEIVKILGGVERMDVLEKFSKSLILAANMSIMSLLN